MIGDAHEYRVNRLGESGTASMIWRHEIGEEGERYAEERVRLDQTNFWRNMNEPEIPVTRILSKLIRFLITQSQVLINQKSRLVELLT